MEARGGRTGLASSTVPAAAAAGGRSGVGGRGLPSGSPESESGGWVASVVAVTAEVEEKDCSNGLGSRSKLERRGGRTIEGWSCLPLLVARSRTGASWAPLPPPWARARDGGGGGEGLDWGEADVIWGDVGVRQQSGIEIIR
jgi:hypothetical protein